MNRSQNVIHLLNVEIREHFLEVQLHFGVRSTFKDFFCWRKLKYNLKSDFLRMVAWRWSNLCVISYFGRSHIIRFIHSGELSPKQNEGDVVSNWLGIPVIIVFSDNACVCKDRASRGVCSGSNGVWEWYCLLRKATLHRDLAVVFVFIDKTATFWYSKRIQRTKAASR